MSAPKCCESCSRMRGAGWLPSAPSRNTKQDRTSNRECVFRAFSRRSGVLMATVSSFAEIESEFIERAHRMVWCAMATIDTGNRPRTRIMHPIWEGANGWASSRVSSLKGRHIAKNPNVSLAYISEIVTPVYADCTVEWEHDLERKHKVWEMFKSAAP